MTSPTNSRKRKLQRNITSVLEMNAFDYQTKCLQFERKCSQQDTSTMCIDWNGYISSTGYGKASLFGKMRQAHAVAWELANLQEIPIGMVVRHQCQTKNKRCVNENHLTIGTHEQNAQDEIARCGSKHPNAKILEEMAQAIVDSLDDGDSARERAIKFGVPRHMINDIDCANSWKHLITPVQIQERLAKVKKTPFKLTDEDFQIIKTSLDSSRVNAKRWNISMSSVKKIKNGTCKSPSEKRQIAFNDVINRILQKSTVFVDVAGSKHLLYKGNATQDPREPLHHKTSFLGKGEYVTRAMYMATNKITSIAGGLVIRHKCVYKCCVNIDCLETGTQKENAADQVRDKTQPRGETHSRTTITTKMALDIKYTIGIRTVAVRSAFFNVRQALIYDIDVKKSWKYLIDDEYVEDSNLIANLNAFVYEKSKERKIHH